ncbi:histone protein [Streptomyces sp. NPDC006638]|uniref:histone protein n=1 Tax=unclassified Streptomyces TaxID=2593676 RepID=UPI00339F3A3D
MAENSKFALGAAIVGGYVLGRTKKGRLALTAATYLTGKRMGVSPRQLISGGVSRLGEVPQVAELQEQVRTEGAQAARKALTSVASRGMGSLSGALGGHGPSFGGKGGKDEEQEGDEEEYEDEYEEGEPEDSDEEEPEEATDEETDEEEPDDEEPDEEEDDEEAAEEPQRRHPRSQRPERPAPKKRQPARRAPAKKSAPAKKTAAKKGTPAGKSGRKNDQPSGKAAKKTSPRADRRR